MASLAALSWIWAFFGVMTLCSGAVEKPGAILLTIVVFFGPIILIRWRVVATRNRTRDVQQDPVDK